MDAIKQFFFTILYQPLFNVLIFLAWLIPGHSIGWAIIALTIIIRVLLIPSTNKMLEHQRQLKALQPKLEALKAQHGDDKQAHQKAMMELYAAERVSPLGGCVTSLIQIPLLLGIYQVIMNGVNGGTSDILYSFIPHIQPSQYWFGIDMTRPEPWILPLVVAALQFIQIKQTTTVTQASGNSEADQATQMITKNMMYIFPVFLWYAARSFPAGLALYYAVFSLFLIIQQAIYLRTPHKAVKVGPDGLIVEDSSARIASKSEIKSETKKGGVTVTVRRKDGGKREN